MSNTTVDKKYLDRAQVILYKAVQEGSKRKKTKERVSALSISRKEIPLPIDANKTMKFESIVVEYSDDRNKPPQNLPIFITSAPLQTESVFFSVNTPVLTQEGWEHHAIEKSLREVYKYARILSRL